MHGARLEVSDAMGRVQVVPIEDDRVTIGRAGSNMVSLDGAEISRRHAEIVKQGDSYILRDVELSQLVQEVLAAVRRFTVGEPQSDDIPVLIARYYGGRRPILGR